ncbi:MAG: sensor domain-containing diguanylate cyclase [Clostridia bacterium]|nr:sensor domain-containing diguanylate cyclase [Clostridia bacterium]
MGFQLFMEDHSGFGSREEPLTKEEKGDQFDGLSGSRNASGSSHEQLKAIIDSLPDATFAIDRDKRVIAWNRALEELTGVRKEDIIGKGDYAYATALYGTTRPMLVDVIQAEDPATERKYDFVERQGNTLYSEVYVPSAYKGKGAFLWAKASPLLDNKGRVVGAIESIRDITERKLREAEMRYHSMHDALTGLFNRAYFEQEMHRLEDCRSCPVGLIIVDIDGLKHVNDTFGHNAGDMLIVAAATAIEMSFRGGDVVARIGGDEFAILLPNSDGVSVEKAAQRIRSLVEKYNKTKPQRSLGLSLGFAIRTSTQTTMRELFREADGNMYKEKASRKRMLVNSDGNTKDNCLG